MNTSPIRLLLLFLFAFPLFGYAQKKSIARDCTVTFTTRNFAADTLSLTTTSVTRYENGRHVYSLSISKRPGMTPDSGVAHIVYDSSGRTAHILGISGRIGSIPDSTTVHYSYDANGNVQQIVRWSIQHAYYYDKTLTTRDTTTYNGKQIIVGHFEMDEYGVVTSADTTVYYDDERRTMQSYVRYRNQELERRLRYHYTYRPDGVLYETIREDSSHHGPATYLTRWAYHEGDTFAVYYLSFTGADSADLSETFVIRDSSYLGGTSITYLNGQLVDSVVSLGDSAGNMIHYFRVRGNTTPQGSRSYYRVSKNRREVWSFGYESNVIRFKWYSRTDTVRSGKGYAIRLYSANYTGTETELKSVPLRKCKKEKEFVYDRQGRQVAVRDYNNGKIDSEMTWEYSR